MRTVVLQRAFEGDSFFMRSFMSIPAVGKNTTTKSYFKRRIPIDVHPNLGIWDVNITDYRWLVAPNIINIIVILA